MKNPRITSSALKGFGISFVLMMLFFSGCTEIPDYVFVDSSTPKSEFTHSINFLEVTVANKATHATTYLWDFGDGSTSELKDPGMHAYAVGGTYTISLEAKDNNGATDVSTVIVTVEKEPTTPLARFSYTANFLVVTFVNESTRATTYEWDFGDGQTSTLENPVVTYAAPGTYTVTLTARNALAEFNTTSSDVTVVSFIATILNPSFEEGDGRDHWVGTMSISGSPTPPDGVRGCKLDGAGKSAAQTFTVEANTSYILKYWYVTKATGSGFTFSIADGVNPGTVIYTETVPFSASTSAYEEKTVVFNSGASTSITIMSAYIDTETRVDHFSIQKN